MALIPLFLIVSAYIVSDPNVAKYALAIYGLLWFLNRR